MEWFRWRLRLRLEILEEGEDFGDLDLVRIFEVRDYLVLKI